MWHFLIDCFIVLVAAVLFVGLAFFTRDVLREDLLVCNECFTFPCQCDRRWENRK